MTASTPSLWVFDGRGWWKEVASGRLTRVQIFGPLVGGVVKSRPCIVFVRGLWDIHYLYCPNPFTQGLALGLEDWSPIK